MGSKLSIRMATVALVAIFSASNAAAATFTVDKAHSSVEFSVRHLLSKTKGRFGSFTGTVEMDPAKRDAVKVSGSIEVASIDTADEKRDEHLRSADFFDAGKYPEITFTADTLSDVDADRSKGKLAGTLTMHGVSKPIVLEVEWFGIGKDPWGNVKAAFAATTSLNRKDYGIVWNKTLDNGGVLVGDEIDIEIAVEAYVKE